MVCGAECHAGYHWDEIMSRCVEATGSEDTRTYVACPEAPAAASGAAGTEGTDSAAVVAVDDSQVHLYGCAVCIQTQATTVAAQMFCEICRPGYMMHNGGCYNADMGTHTPNDEMCDNCAECLRFDQFGSSESVYKCNTCLDGFFQDEPGTECNAPAQNHCTHVEG